jgi:hypothetical protein
VTSNTRKILFLVPVVSVADEHPWIRRSLYQDTIASSKVMKDESIAPCRRLDVLMHVVPGAKGAQTNLTVVGSWRDWMNEGDHH